MNTAREKTYLVHDMAASLSWYLNFMSTIGRDYVIDEKTLKIPITEYLESSVIETIKLEDPHPNFDGRSIDLTFKDMIRKEHIAFEFKFLKGTLQAHCQSPTSQRFNQSFVKELAKPTHREKLF
jgi:hypothetical protein